MPNLPDARVRVVFGPAGMAGPGDALLLEGADEAPAGLAVARFTPGLAGHRIGCACCAPRTAVAEAMRRLFLDRARGTGAPFTRLVVAASPAGEAAVRQALAEDVFLLGRYCC